ncbi:MAG: PTS sugar transporter subunit IIA [Gemmatimonadales bacterium]
MRELRFRRPCRADAVLLSDFLPPDHVRLALQATDKTGLLRELSEFLAGMDGGDAQRLLHAVEEREAAMSTGIGQGVAVPHSRSEGVDRLCVVAGRTEHPVAFDAPDGTPVRLLFMVAGPPGDALRHVQVLGRIARLVQRDDLRVRLLVAETPAAFAAVIRESEES